MARSAHVLGAVASTALVLGASVVAATPATASHGGRGDDVINQGRCDGSARWKVKAKPEDGRLKVEGEVDSNRTGQTWAWKIKNGDQVVARGTATTRGRSGSFSVERRIADGAGQDRITFLASQRGADQTCRGSVTL